MNNASVLRKQAKTTRMRRLNNCLSFLLLLLVISSCSLNAEKNKEIEYIYPPDNPFPSIFQVRRYKDQNLGLTAKLKPKTIKMSCRLRNDSPYYWCDFEGKLISPDPKLPKKISSTFHVVVAEIGKKAALSFAKRMRKNNEPVTIVLARRASKSNADDSIYSQLFGVFNSKECFDVFDRYSLCPKTAKKLDIFSGKYLK